MKGRGPVSRRHTTFVGAAAVILGALLTQGPAWANSDRSCQGPQTRPTVNFQRKTGQVVYSNGHSRQQLMAMRSRRGNVAPLGAGWHPVGLTETELQTSMNVRVIGRRQGSSHCVALERVDMATGFERIRVHVARKYRPGTCEYQAILEHENLHVRNFKQGLREYLPQIERALRRAAAQQGTQRFLSIDAGATHFREIMTTTVQPIITRMNRSVALADARIDTRESYRANQSRCANW